MSKKRNKKDPYAAREALKYERPIPSREFILEHLGKRKKPASFTDLMNELSLAGDEAELALHRRLKAMVRDDQLERLKGGLFWLVGHRVLLEGTVLIDKGKERKTWLVPSDGSARVELPLREAQGLFSGNHVIISTVDVGDGHPRTGKLVEIVEQQRVILTGKCVFDGVFQVITHGRELSQPLIIPKGKENGAKEGDIVVVELLKQPDRSSQPRGQVIEILGQQETSGIEIQTVIRAFGLPHQWLNESLKQVKAIPTEILEADIEHRLDLREYPFVTIDGEDARDFDDAVYCEATPSGGYKLMVAIADVSHYVIENTPLDKEAKDRGNSVYFPDHVIPMLPEKLSNHLCSLNPEVDRLCMVATMTINADGQITRYQFDEGIICSKARLTYTIANALMTGQATKQQQSKYKSLLPYLDQLYQLYQLLKAQRQVRGAIEFETVETKVVFGKNGKIDRIEPVKRNEAHRVIEECMLAANVACAKFLKKHKLPGLFRNHEAPPFDKITDLRAFLHEIGLSLSGGQTPKPLDYAKLLHSIQHREDANIIQTVLLRSLSQAVYSKDNIGHFGLAYPIYTHFTSPIRRYPDLLIHRQIRLVLRGQWDAKKQQKAKSNTFQKQLHELGLHVSMTERRADDATRDALRWLKCEYMENHIGEEFEGVISGVTRFGFFVELKDIYVDGLVHVTSLNNDFYYFDATHHALIGERSGITYKLGKTLRVRVVRVDVDDRKIDFELIDLPKVRRQKQTKTKKDKRKRKKR